MYCIGTDAVSRCKCSTGTFACALTNPRSRYLSWSAKCAMSLSTTLCQTSQLNRVPFISQACLNSRPI
jgi:hypothetical protein